MANGDQVLWEAVAASLRDDISSERLRPGEDIPPELDLAKRWATSRTTIRRAIEALTAEGLITEGRGRRGRQVRDSKPFDFYAVQSESRARMAERMVLGTDAWVTEAAKQGRQASQNIEVTISEAAPDVARRLELPANGRVVVRRRVRFLDGEPHDRNNTYYPADIAEGTRLAQPEDIPEGGIAYMASLGYDQTRFTDEVSARNPAPDNVRELRIPRGVPVLIQYRTGCTTERPVKLTVTTWPADRVRLVWEWDDTDADH